MNKEDLDDIKYVHKNLMEGLKVPLTKMSKERKLNIIIGLKDVTDGEFGMLIRGKTEITLEAYMDLKESQDISLADEVIEMMLESLNQNKDE